MVQEFDDSFIFVLAISFLRKSASLLHGCAQSWPVFGIQQGILSKIGSPVTRNTGPAWIQIELNPVQSIEQEQGAPAE